MMSRGRKDDTELKINGRLKWFEKEVLPTIEFFREHRLYEFYEINGEQSVNDIHQEIKSKLNL
jgi:adenylate kinase family enzyme